MSLFVPIALLRFADGFGPGCRKSTSGKGPDGLQRFFHRFESSNLPPARLQDLLIYRAISLKSDAITGQNQDQARLHSLKTNEVCFEFFVGEGPL